MRILFLDCFSGISGDMTLGSLVDLGADREYIERELKKLGVDGYTLSWKRVVKKGLSALKADVLLTDADAFEPSRPLAGGSFKVLHSHGDAHGHSHDHDHAHGHAHGHSHDHDHAHGHAHGHSHDHDHSHGHAHGHSHDHDHAHGHAHGHSHDHDHAHGHTHGHSHDHDHAHGHAHGHLRGHDHTHGHTHGHSHDHVHGHAHGHSHDHDHAHGHAHGHSHDHDHVHGHHHRTYADIVKLIRDAGLSQRATDISLAIFKKIGAAEAKIHGVPMETVHFHEVGAVDSIVDIVGVALAIDSLNPDRIMSTPVPLGSGTIKIDHGVYPVPAPATLEMMRGLPVAPSNHRLELTTPTGAGIIAALVDEFCNGMPSMIVESIGYGAGTRDLPNQPNVLRSVLGFAEKRLLVWPSPNAEAVGADDRFSDQERHHRGQ